MRIILAVLVALAFPGGAIGATPPEGWGTAELQVAQAYWGVTTPPLCGSTTVEFDAPLPPRVVGLATIPASPNTACWMKIARSGFGIFTQCLTVVHEFGHWMGLPHSADPSSPMAAELNPLIHVRGCERLVKRARG